MKTNIFLTLFLLALGILLTWHNSEAQAVYNFNFHNYANGESQMKGLTPADNPKKVVAETSYREDEEKGPHVRAQVKSAQKTFGNGLWAFVPGVMQNNIYNDQMKQVLRGASLGFQLPVVPYFSLVPEFVQFIKDEGLLRGEGGKANLIYHFSFQKYLGMNIGGRGYFYRLKHSCEGANAKAQAFWCGPASTTMAKTAESNFYGGEVFIGPSIEGDVFKFHVNYGLGQGRVKNPHLTQVDRKTRSQSVTMTLALQF